MDLLDTYISEVGKHLPAKQRPDIEAEIRSAITDMLEDKSQKAGSPVDEAMTLDVLQAYGEPEKVASTYLPEQYVIGPRLFSAFKTTLQIILPILGLLALIGFAISFSRLELNAANIIELIIESLAGYLVSVVQTLGGLVVVFYILQIAAPNLETKSTQWDARSLLKISLPDRIFPSGPVWEIAANMAAIVIFNFFPQIIGLAYRSGSGWVTTPILSETFYRYLPALNLLWVMAILLNVFLLRRGQWQTGTRWLSLGLRLVSVGILAAMVAGPSLIALNAESLSQILQKQTAETLTGLLEWIVRLNLIIILITSLVDAVKQALRLFAGVKPAVIVSLK